MEELTMIYKILSVVRDNMDNPESYESQLSPEALGLSKPKWSRIMALIKDAKFMEGISVEWSFDSTERYPNVVIKRPEITLGGLEYLEEAKGVPEYNIKLEFDTSPLGEVEKKIESMSEHLEKAMELAASIASTSLDLRINAVVDGKPTEFARITTE